MCGGPCFVSGPFLRIFVLPPTINPSLPMALDDFEEIQYNAINQLAMSLRYTKA